MRSFVYWSASSALAVIATRAAAESENLGMALADGAAAGAFASIPESARAVLLGIGIMAIAFTYRRVWLNIRPE